MNIRSLKPFYFVLIPLFIFLIHLSFVYAKSPMEKKAASCEKVSMSSAPATVSVASREFMYDSLKLSTLGLSKQAFEYAVKGFNFLRSSGKLNNDNILSIVDFSLPSSKKRLFVIDMENSRILFNTYVAHGRNSGKEYASQFSNSPESFKSSPGFYITRGTYTGGHGFSLQLEGEEKGINDNASSRAIVIHSADYVNENLIKSQGYIGRSLGCPALPRKYATPIIETIKNGTCFFMFTPNSKYISNSRLLHGA